MSPCMIDSMARAALPAETAPAARSRAWESRAGFPSRFARTTPPGRTDGRAASCAALRSRHTRQIVLPRSPATPDAGPLNPQPPYLQVHEYLVGDRRGSSDAPVASRWSAWWHATRRAAAAQAVWSPPRDCGSRRGGGSACARGPTATPPTAPPSAGEGDLWGDI